jgi:LDH2 family malate/lactate/ureidoglycolate dehydrogenase
MVPGDPERLQKNARMSAGISIEKGTWEAIIEAALSVGLDIKKFNLPESRQQ